MIRTAVDSSVLLDVFSADPAHGEASLEALQQCFKEGILIACEVVWAEIRPRFETEKALLNVAQKIQLAFEPISQESAFKAGVIWKEYHTQGGRRDRMIPDFLVGAHALVQTDRLLSRDRGFYRRYFRGLKIVEP